MNEKQIAALKKLVDAGHSVWWHRIWTNGQDYVRVMSVDLENQTAMVRPGGRLNLFNTGADYFIVRSEVELTEHPEWKANQ